jgi:hypothetical protein
MQGNYMVPGGLMNRVKNPDLYRSVARFRFHEKVVARKSRDFFRL